MTIASQLTVVIATVLEEKALDKRLRYGSESRDIALLLKAIERGETQGKVLCYIDDGAGTAAAQTAAFTQVNGDAGDTVTVLDVVFTVAASPSSDPSDGEFAAVTSDDQTGENFAAAVNAHPKLAGLVTAANSSGTVTITFVNKGVFGNAGTLATSDATFCSLGAATFASGANSSTIQKDWFVLQSSKTHA